MMDETTKELIAVGASVAAHCQPCLRFHVEKAAALGIDSNDIAEAVAVGKMVQKGGLAAMRSYADSLLEEMAAAESVSTSAKEAVVSIYEPAMCCSTGICGPNVDSRLIAFAGALKQIAAAGIVVKRFNLAQEPQAFVGNERVKADLASLGYEKLPYIYLNDELRFSANYPETSELFTALGLDAEKLIQDAGGTQLNTGGLVMAAAGGADENAGDCCPGGGCC